MIHLYRSTRGAVAHADGRCRVLADEWDDLLRRDDLPRYVSDRVAAATGAEDDHVSSIDDLDLLPPIVSQEVWAAGVTYYRSRDARMEESKDAGGGSFYDRVYVAERPELFMKATPHRVVGHGQSIRIRSDSKWNVPEPELTLAISAGGVITGFTVGNDMSSRDIEGENPLYLPQAKVYSGCAGLGPGLLLSEKPLPPDTSIELRIERADTTVFDGATALAELKRKPEELVAFLYRDNSFPNGCFLMTGTGIVPPSDFTLEPGDVVSITIRGIGTLSNTVSRA